MHGEIRREQFLERPLPSSEESERAILGAILLDNDLIQSAIESLEPEDFYSPLHRRVFKAMRDLAAAATPIDPILIGEELKKDGSIESIGGVVTITNLTYGLPHFSDLTDYIKTVRQKSDVRQLIRVCGSISLNAIDEENDSTEIFADAQKQINDLCLQVETGASDGYFVPLSNIIDNEVVKALDELRHGKSQKIKTYFDAIDSAIGGGLSLSDVLLIAADTGAGKSALALQLAFQIASTKTEVNPNGIPTAFLAGEMTNKENVLRLLSQVSGITNLNWLSHISDTEHQNLVEWAMHIRDSPIQFEHRISDLATLRTHLRSIVRRNKVKVLVIDYIQLFKLEKVERRKRHERIAEASQEVKRLANELDIAIIEVAQFNREGAKSVQAGLHDLEGSGQLEKDASLIFILELGEAELAAEDRRKYCEAKIRIVKGRNVGKGEVHGRFYGRSVRFDFS